MKYLKYAFLLILSFFIYHPSQAQGGVYGSILDFSIDATSLTQSGKIKLSTTGITTVKYKVQIGRSNDANNQTPNPNDFNWYPVDIGIGLGRYDKGYVWFEGSATITNADFKAYESSLTKEFTAKIDNSKLISGQKIVLVYELHLPGVPSSNWSKTSYLSVDYNFEYPVTVFYNVAKSKLFIRNNCSPGSEPEAYNYIVPASKHSSTISQADADQKAQNDINTNGQIVANSSGKCIEFGDVKTPETSFQFGYINTQDIKWNINSFSGNVKIESYTYDSTLGDFVLTSVISDNNANTGILKDGISHKNLGNIGNSDVERKIKITSINSGIGYFSNAFQLALD